MSCDHAMKVWQSAVDAVRPARLMRRHVEALRPSLALVRRILVVGAGKAGGAMAAAFEDLAGEHIDKIEGLVNVPENAVRPLRRIRLHAARPAASNQPTPAGVVGSEAMLDLVRGATTDDLVVCLLSGGGSALLPAPDGVTLEVKQHVTKLLHAAGATINEMNAVRKHLSRVKGGRLAEACNAGELVSLIISDVVGDPLDVIASGPTAPDPTTFADALAVIDKYRLDVPEVVAYLRSGDVETPKALPANVRNVIIGNNAVALAAATTAAESLGYRVVSLGPDVEGDTRKVAAMVAVQVRELPAGSCLLVGGETTVTLGTTFGKGGRNQEFVLAMLDELGEARMRNVVAMSGGTDGEDGPTDAAGAIADASTWPAIRGKGLSVSAALDGHDAYPLFDAVGGLVRTGLTETNVMDVRVVLVTSPSGA